MTSFYSDKYARQQRLREEMRKAALFRQRKIDQGLRRLAPPAEPTDAVPGSRAKIAVLQARVARDEFLFHPADVTHFSTED
jgi:hypothetical protein